MNSFKAYIWKEYIELIRTKRIIVFAAVFLFFAILDPVMIKVLPMILKSQLQNITPEQMGITQEAFAGLASFAGDMFEIITIVSVLTLMGITAGERKEKTIVLPRIAGLKFEGTIIAKLLVNGLTLSVITVIAFCVSYLYSTLLFTESGGLYFKDALLSSLIYCVHFIFIIALCIFFGSGSSKGLYVSIMTILIIFGGAAISALLPKFKEYLPYFLIESGSKLKPDINALKSIGVTFALIILLSILSINKMKKTES